MRPTHSLDNVKLIITESRSKEPFRSLQDKGRSPQRDESLYFPRLLYVPEHQIQFDEKCVLGSGAFGTVYKGSYQGTAAAVKKISRSEDFMHEILVSLRLSHPNIVRLMAAAKTQTSMLLASEYIHGDNLENALYCEESPVKLSNDDRLYVALEVLMAVEYIHSKNIIHQDIKPSNILIEAKSKKALLTDWGMANIKNSVFLESAKKMVLQKIGPVGGTPLYMAPECAVHYFPSTKKSDMWSVGATLTELFTESQPWHVKSAREIYMAMCSELPPHSMTLLDPKIFSFLGKCFSYTPKLRPDASDVICSMKALDEVQLEKKYGYTW